MNCEFIPIAKNGFNEYFTIDTLEQVIFLVRDPVESLKNTKEVFDMSCSPQNGGSTSFNVINYNLFTEKIDGKNCIAYFFVCELLPSVWSNFPRKHVFHGEVKSKFLYRTFWRKLFALLTKFNF